MNNQNVNKDIDYMTHKIENYLKELCITISDRAVGSQGNQQATEFFAKTIRSFGFKTECPVFDCIEWTCGNVILEAGKENFKAFVSPYSLSYVGNALLVKASTLDELEKIDTVNKIIFINGELAKEQLMPKNFPFYNPENHQKIIALLERKKPAAIIAATGVNPELVGAQYPFPLFEDGDFDIPSVFMKDIDGERLSNYINRTVTLKFESMRIPSKGTNVIARKGNNFDSRIIFCAHIDSRKGTSGALDDGGGIATLLALAELLKEYNGTTGIEIIAFNGEDYYAAPGQQQYLSMNKATLNQITLAINLDDVGYFDGGTQFSFYECPDNLVDRLMKRLIKQHRFSEGKQWYQGDHMIFVLDQIPAVAFISEKADVLMKEIVHTEKDTVDLIDYRKLADIACALRDIVSESGSENIYA